MLLTNLSAHHARHAVIKHHYPHLLQGERLVVCWCLGWDGVWLDNLKTVGAHTLAGEVDGSTCLTSPSVHDVAAACTTTYL